MLVIVVFLLFGDRFFAWLNRNEDKKPEVKNFTSVNGTSYHYYFYKAKWIPTSIGGFLTGLLSTGIGEVTVPQLVKLGKVDVAVAAGTSVFVVFISFLCASVTHCYTLIQHGGMEAVPWHLVCYTIPGVLIGGQIGPRLQGLVSSEKMINGIAIVFVCIGMAMIGTVIKDYYKI
jgi:uncharacterized membrane protein YfcA